MSRPELDASMQQHPFLRELSLTFANPLAHGYVQGADEQVWTRTLPDETGEAIRKIEGPQGNTIGYEYIGIFDNGFRREIHATVAEDESGLRVSDATSRLTYTHTNLVYEYIYEVSQNSLTMQIYNSGDDEAIAQYDLSTGQAQEVSLETTYNRHKLTEIETLRRLYREIRHIQQENPEGLHQIALEQETDVRREFGLDTPVRDQMLTRVFATAIPYLLTASAAIQRLHEDSRSAVVADLLESGVGWSLFERILFAQAEAFSLPLLDETFIARESNEITDRMLTLLRLAKNEERLQILEAGKEYQPDIAFFSQVYRWARAKANRHEGEKLSNLLLLKKFLPEVANHTVDALEHILNIIVGSASKRITLSFLEDEPTFESTFYQRGYFDTEMQATTQEGAFSETQGQKVQTGHEGYQFNTVDNTISITEYTEFTHGRRRMLTPMPKQRFTAPQQLGIVDSFEIIQALATLNKPGNMEFPLLLQEL